MNALQVIGDRLAGVKPDDSFNLALALMANSQHKIDIRYVKACGVDQLMMFTHRCREASAIVGNMSRTEQAQFRRELKAKWNGVGVKP